MKNIPDDPEKKFFQERFEAFESQPDEKVWQYIRKSLPADSDPQRKKRIAVLCLFLFCIVGYYFTMLLLGPDSPALVKTNKLITGNSDRTQAPENQKKAKSESAQTSIPTPPVSGKKEVTKEARFGKSTQKPVNLILKKNMSHIVFIPSTEKRHPFVQNEFQTPLFFDKPENIQTATLPPFVLLKQRPISLNLSDSTVLISVKLANLLDQIPQASPTKRMTLHPYVAVMPSLGYYEVFPLKNDSLKADGLSLGGTWAGQRWGWQVQAGFSQHLSGRFNLRAGVFFQQVHEQLSYSYQKINPENRTIQTISSQEVIINPISENRMFYLNRIQQNVGITGVVLVDLTRLRGLKHYLTGGLQSNFVSRGGRTSGQTSLLLGYGFTRPLLGGYHLFAEPTLRYDFTSQTDAGGLFRWHPYRLGLNLGLRF